MKRIVLALILILVLLEMPLAFAAGNGEIAYRAIMIGIDAYQTNALTGCVNDATRMSEMLLTANDAGAFYQSPTIRSNLQTDEISSLFREIQVWGADDDDVTMFYFAGHGYMSDKGNPAIVGKDNKMLRITDLIELLDGIPGIKMVVFDCRYAGSLVTDGNSQNAINVFNTAVTDAFKNSDTAASYYVLCASTLSSAGEEADNNVDDYGLITYYMTQGCGYDYISKSQTDTMPADLNDNGAVSFGEIQEYVDKCVADNDPDAIYGISTFPQSSAYPLLARRATTEVVEVTLPQTEMEISIGRKVDLDATVLPANASMRSIYWSSSDLSIVGVDDMGSVEGYKPGTATISATTTNGLTKSMIVNVVDVTYIDNMLMNTGRLVLAPNSHANLTVKVEPEDASETVLWSSQNEQIATVDQNGRVTCNAIGDTIITAYTQNGVETMCTLNVVKADEVVKSMEFAKTEYNLYVGESKTLQYNIKPKNALDTAVEFKSSDESVATVTGENILNTVAPGDCVIYATASSGVTTGIDVSVRSASIELNKNSLSLKKGKTATLKAQIKPSQTGASVSWTSSDPEIASVENGLVKALSSGETVITASMDDGTSADCSVIVDGVAVKNIKVRPQKATVKAGETTELTVSVAPENATVKDCVWKSNKEDIATVDENGVVTGVSSGTAIISVKSHNGKKAKALVKVTGTSIGASATDAASDDESPTGFALDQSEVTMIAGLPGQNKITLSVSAQSESALKWISSDPKVASVNNNGVVTAKSAGKAVIKVTTSGKKSATCQVTVTENKVVNKTPYTGSEELLYTSARRMFYKNNSTLVVEMYFVNKTSSAVKVPEEGNLMILLSDGRVLNAREVKGGDKKLKPSKKGVIAYSIKIDEGSELYGLNLTGAAAEIVKDGESPLQSVAVVDQATEPNDPEALSNAESTPEPIDDAYVNDDSFIDNPFGSDDDWDDTVMNTADYDI